MWLGIPFHLCVESKFSNFQDVDVLGSVNSEQPTPRCPSFIAVAICHLPPSSLPCRTAGFRLSLGTLALLTVLGALGIANSFLDEYLDLDIAKKLRHF